MGSLGAPTDPSATLAVTHEYNAQGDVSETILGVAAFDDALGVINYSVATAVACALVLHRGLNIQTSVLSPVVDIVGAIGLGAGFGLVLNGMTRLVKKESEGVPIVLIIGLLSLCFGTALGARASDTPPSVRKYAAGGLIPQGGIVIGLALLIKQNEAFDPISGIIIGTVIGATVIHEIIGPLLAKWSLKRAGEI